MNRYNRYEEMWPWQASRDLVEKVIDLTSTGAMRDDKPMREELLESSLSMLNSIAQGCGRHSIKGFLQHLDEACGKAARTQSMLQLANDIGYIERRKYDELHRLTDRIMARTRVLATMLRKEETFGPASTRFDRMAYWDDGYNGCDDNDDDGIPY
jgi:four helix bundle protein